MKKKNRRSNRKFPALEPEYNLKTRQELIDYDYVSKLSLSEKKWLNKFTEEYVNANLDRENYSNNLHNTKKLKQDCDRRNNKRKADLFTVMKVTNEMLTMDEYRTHMLEVEGELLTDSAENLDDTEDKPSNGSE